MFDHNQCGYVAIYDFWPSFKVVKKFLVYGHKNCKIMQKQIRTKSIKPLNKLTTLKNSLSQKFYKELKLTHK